MTSAQVKLPPKLIPVFEGRADARWSCGGRGSAKTRSFAKMVAVFGYRFGKQGLKGQLLCARQHLNTLEDSSLEECKRAIEEEPWLLEYYELGDKYIKSRDGAISFSFAGLDRNIGSIKSKGRILLCWVDEAEPVTETAWQTLIPTLREEGDNWNAELWVTWNPRRKGAPVEHRFRFSQDPLVKGVVMNWRDNPKFPEKLERERQRDEQDRPESYDHVWEGGYETVIVGAIYAKQLNAAVIDGRITTVPIESAEVVNTFWDLGKGRQAAVWFHQEVGLQNRFIDYYQPEAMADIDEMAKEIKRRGYNYGMHYMPHDVEHQILGLAKKNRKEMFEAAGVRPITVVPRIDNVESGIEMTRKAFASCWFDAERCADGLSALGSYRYEFNDKTTNYRPTPLHNWASHPADAFRQFGQGYQGRNYGWAAQKPADSQAPGVYARKTKSPWGSVNTDWVV